MKPGKLISIGGEKKEVTVNLWEALRHLRYPERRRVIWVDALCINQEDTLERNHQVNQMGRIYGEADCVIAWLGPVLPEENHRVQILFTWVIEQLKQRATLRLLPLREHTAFGHLVPLGIDARHESHDRLWALEFLDYISTKSYWNRTWIVQEVVKASHLAIRCGQHEVGVQGLEMIEELLHRDILEPVSQVQVRLSVPMQILKQRRFSQEQTNLGKPSLENLIYITRRSLATDPRDKIFALYSLLSDSNERDAIIIDYEMETKELYQNVIEGLILRGRLETAVNISSILQTFVDSVQRALENFLPRTSPPSSPRFSYLMYEWMEDGSTKTGK
jgi:hypothetical protein